MARDQDAVQVPITPTGIPSSLSTLVSSPPTGNTNASAFVNPFQPITGGFQTSLGGIDLGGPTSVGQSGFEDIDALIRARTPEALGLITQGSEEALRLSGLGAQAVDPLRRFGNLDAFNEQQALLGLSGQTAQRSALAGIPVSDANQEAQRRQRETLLRRASASGDVSGATLQSAQQLSGAQQLQNIQTRLAQLEPLAGIARTTRSTLSQQEEAKRAREAQLISGRGTQLANIRLGVAAPQISSIQQRAELSGLQGISKAQQQASLLNTVGNLAGKFSPQIEGFFNQPPAPVRLPSSTINDASIVI